MFLLQFSQAEIDKASTSTSSAMTVIQDHYTLCGMPRLDPMDQATLMGVIDDLRCSLVTSPPPDVPRPQLDSFCDTLKSMWIDLGGNPDDLHC